MRTRSGASRKIVWSGSRDSRSGRRTTRCATSKAANGSASRDDHGAKMIGGGHGGRERRTRRGPLRLVRQGCCFDICTSRGSSGELADRRYLVRTIQCLPKYSNEALTALKPRTRHFNRVRIREAGELRSSWYVLAMRTASAAKSLALN